MVAARAAPTPLGAPFLCQLLLCLLPDINSLGAVTALGAATTLGFSALATAGAAAHGMEHRPRGVCCDLLAACRTPLVPALPWHAPLPSLRLRPSGWACLVAPLQAATQA